VLEGDSIGLKTLYSIDPPAQVQANGTKTGGGEDINFWLGLKAKTMKVEIVRLRERTYGKSVIFKATVQTADGRTIDITNAQAWRKDGEQWHVFNVERTDSPHLQQPSDMNKDIYPADKDARTEIKEAEEKAAAQHRRVLLIFGANWCYDCHVLDLALHRPDFQPAVRGYEIVHVDIGPDGTKNADVAKQYDVPLDSGVPALAIIESDGKVVVSQKNGEFEDARALTPEVLLEFLNRWKPEAR
jgi:thioredoxin 1